MDLFRSAPLRITGCLLLDPLNIQSKISFSIPILSTLQCRYSTCYVTVVRGLQAPGSNAVAEAVAEGVAEAVAEGLVLE